MPIIEDDDIFGSEPVESSTSRAEASAPTSPTNAPVRQPSPEDEHAAAPYPLAPSTPQPNALRTSMTPPASVSKLRSPLHSPARLAGSKSSALDALNAFGRASSPARRVDDDEEEDTDFDLDREIELKEETSMQQEQHAKSRVTLEDDFDFDVDQMLEDEEEEEREQPKRAPAATSTTTTRVELEDDFDMDAVINDYEQSTRQANPVRAPAAMTARARLDAHGIGARRGPGAVMIDNDEYGSPTPAPTKNRDPLIGTNGLPKYIPSGLFSATTLDGVTIKFEKRKRMHGWKPLPPHYGQGSTGLLGRPAHVVRLVAEGQAAQAVVDRDDRNERIAAAKKAALAGGANSSVRAEVWAEKYRPHRYTELIGDDRIHRDVIGWLKQWDMCVFKRQDKRKKVKGEDLVTAATPAYTGYAGPGGFTTWVDPWHRPQERVLLISGPPGLGKTTLAHVVAQACGYAVHELNASDARNAGAVEDRIKMAVESGASINDDRPTCVIIDEIDGATGGGGGASGESQGFVRSLCKLIEDGKGKGAGKKGRKGKKRRPLLRPIICICNDLYAPALRPLRPMAKLIRLTKPTTNHLVARLRSVCEKESLTTDTRTLSLLAELTDNDVRACLNALQMARAQGDSLRVKDMKDGACGLGVKDGGSSTTKVWEVLFRTASPKERARGAGPKDEHEMARKIVHEVSACGDPDRILAGCFEHYPLLKPQDDGWWRYNAAHNWMYWAETLNEKGWQLGTHELHQYAAWSFVPWHLLFANTVNELPSFPRADYENYLKRSAFDEVVAELHALLPANLRALFGKDSIITELGPSLIRMLSPDLRPVNSQVVRPEEKETLLSVVSIMLGLNLSMVQDRTEEGTLVFRIEPELDAFVQYEGKRSSAVAPARFAIRQAIVREMEATQARLRTLGTGLLNPEGTVIDYKALAAQAAAGAIAAYKQGDAEQPTARAAAEAQKAAVDFFGRPVVPKAVKAKVPTIGEDEAAAIRSAEGEAEREKAAQAKAAPSLPSLLMERRAARMAAQGAANPHVKLSARPAPVTSLDGSAPKRAKI